MIAALRKPLPPEGVLGGTALLLFGVALYCFAYNALAGRSESLIVGFGWSLANVVPWFLAVEAGKRLAGFSAKMGVLALAFVSSLVLQLLLSGSPDDLPFQLLRRLPWLGASAALLILLGHSSRSTTAAATQLPLLPRQIDWVSAAGNYVELHAHGRTIVHRASLGAVEARLAEEGFVRIHRSTLVRRGAVARIRAVDVLLHDGTSLKLGNKYRSALEAADSRPFVTAE